MTDGITLTAVSAEQFDELLEELRAALADERPAAVKAERAVARAERDAPFPVCLTWRTVLPDASFKEARYSPSGLRPIPRSCSAVFEAIMAETNCSAEEVGAAAALLYRDWSARFKTAAARHRCAELRERAEDAPQRIWRARAALRAAMPPSVQHLCEKLRGEARVAEWEGDYDSAELAVAAVEQLTHLVDAVTERRVA